MLKKKILWADDDVDDLNLMKEILVKHRQEFEIIEARNGREALTLLNNSAPAELPNLIILDINMPILDGKETLSVIRQSERYDNIPVVVFTTSSSELDKMFCKKHNVEMITKPPQYRSLETALLRLLHHSN